ncbi:hypothetical protein ACUH7Y_06910 [Clostridium beijerinckii]|uniref:Uncharacterized protein n=1 Tax=Clostridium beijerinckii TaxID=1520 RepID=A0A7X9SQL3_CLOBE|nr:hypothetical protein [Clostridium beijerinckii]NMF06291.1 hypothetical protein [Clostridium beijerinckii]
MGNIDIISRIAADRQKAKEIAYRVQDKRAKGDSRTFAQVLQEELDKQKAIKNTGK